MNKAAPIKMPRIWMNVTTSVNWNRPAVGIVRVEQELFKALSGLLGEQLRPCVLANGKFVPYNGQIGQVTATLSEPEPDEIIWPDPSYDFPESSTLDLVRTRPLAKRSSRWMARIRHDPDDEIQFGDVLLSVGLDWDWDKQGLDTILYDLKTRKDVKVITCCYDLIPVLFPHYCVGDVAAKFTEYFTNLTWSSSAMLAISRRSEADYRALASDLGMPEIPTRVMLLGNKLPERGQDISDDVQEICDGRFILFVSTIERRKNHDIIYRALHILGERGQLDPEMKVVFVGMPGWGVGDLLKDIELDPITKGHIVLLNHANDAELRALYETCDFLVFPSFYEGWGLPIAEALALGKFVIASDRGSIPEVGGDLVEYVDPWNASAWADTLSKYFADLTLVEQRAARIRKEYHPISWDEAASTVVNLIQTVQADALRTLSFEPGYDMQTQVGVYYGPKIVSTGAAGVLCHGPYQPLPAGRIRVVVDLELNLTEPCELRFKLSADKGLTVLCKERRRIPAARRTSTIEFDLTLDHAVEDFEVVVICPEDVSVAITKLKIQI